MKRRLMNTYNQITMPEGCAQRIEEKLRRTLEENRSGQYTRKIAPAVHRIGSWKPVAAMLLVLCIGCGIVLSRQACVRPISQTSASQYAITTPAAPSETGHISLGTVQIITETHKEAHGFYDSILRGTERIDFPEWNARYTIAQYCDRRSTETGRTVICTQFTLVDMDDDGVKELILRISPEGEPLDDYLVLRYQQNDGVGIVYCYAELRQMISGLKKDGAFFWEKENARWVASLKEINDEIELSILEAAQKSPVRWHRLGISDPAFVLDSYLIMAEEGRGEVLGGQFFYFEQLITGKMDADWKTLQEHLQLNGLRCVMEKGVVSVYDPASPGCVLFGTLDNDGKLDSLGYYVCDENCERMAEIRGFGTEIPEYKVEMNLIWDQNTLGKTVYTPEEILEYFRK